MTPAVLQKFLASLGQGGLEKTRELLETLKGLDLRAIGVLIRFAQAARESDDPYRFLLEALDDKLKKDSQIVRRP